MDKIQKSEKYRTNLNTIFIVASIISSCLILCIFCYNTKSNLENNSVVKSSLTDTALKFDNDFFETDGQRIDRNVTQINNSLYKIESKADTLSNTIKTVASKRTIIKF